jgi:hypothetical protein
LKTLQRSHRKKGKKKFWWGEEFFLEKQFFRAKNAIVIT